jgi:hypothetical protein
MTRLMLPGVLGLFLFSFAGATAKPTDKDLAGTYACEGTNPNGSPYKSLVDIVRQKDTYLVRWRQPDGGEVIGIGIQRDNVFSVSYFGGSPALVVYSVGAEGKLDGQWTMGGAAGRVFTETLTKLSARPEVPEKPAPAPTPRPRPRQRNGIDL